MRPSTRSNPQFPPYGGKQNVSQGASAVAAASAAAHRILIDIIPAQKADLDSRHQSLTVTACTSDWSNPVGEAVGKQVAKNVLESLPRN